MSINETDIDLVAFVSSDQLFLYQHGMSLKTFPGIVYMEASYCVEISEMEGSLTVLMTLYPRLIPFHCILPTADTPTATHHWPNPYYRAQIDGSQI